MLGGHVQRAKAVLCHGCSDGLEQMGFTQSNAGVDKKRVELAAGMLRHGPGGGVGHLVTTPLDKVLKGVLVVQGHRPCGKTSRFIAGSPRRERRMGMISRRRAVPAAVGPRMGGNGYADL